MLALRKRWQDYSREAPHGKLTENTKKPGEVLPVSASFRKSGSRLRSRGLWRTVLATMGAQCGPMFADRIGSGPHAFNRPYSRNISRPDRLNFQQLFARRRST